MPRTRRTDILALAVAAIGTLALVTLSPSSAPERTMEASAPERAIDGLIDAQAAAEVGSWWLDEPTTAAKLSFDPEHERLVWRVSGRSAQVLLDAETGEALAFEFDRS